MNILILYYSMTGSVYRMAQLVAEGVREGGAEAVVKTVPELMPESLIQSDEDIRRGRAEQAEVPVAVPSELGEYDALIVGSPTRFGNMAAQLRNFWDQTGPLWLEGTLIGKPVGLFCSTASMHGGQETTLVSMMMTFFHHGMIVLGVPYSVPEMVETKSGGTPYGASHVAGHPPSVEITVQEAAVCRALGRRVAEVAAKLAA